jgi:Fic family protein
LLNIVRLGLQPSGLATDRTSYGQPQEDPDLIGGFERFIAREDLNPIARAMLTQLEFVTIHPFLDGNPDEGFGA